jgi:protein TonB
VVVAVVVNLFLFSALAGLNRLGQAAVAGPPATSRTLPAWRPEPDRPPPPPEPLPERSPPVAEVVTSPPVLAVDLPPVPAPALPVTDALPLPIELPALTLPAPLTRPLPPPPSQLSAQGRAATVAPPAPAPPEQPLDADAVDQPPRPRDTPPPLYPPVAAKRGITGKVTFKVLIGRDGRVEDLQVLSVDGYQGFARAVRRVVPSWLFTPATHAGQPVRVWGVRTVYFKQPRGGRR